MTKNTKRTRALASFAAAAVAGSSLIWLSQPATANSNVVFATTALNVRAEANTSSSVLGVLGDGEQVERRGDPVGEWTPVTYRGRHAWVYSAYTRLGDLNAAAGGTATATDVVNVRSEASTMSRVLGALQVGEKVGVTGAARGGWVPVNYGGRAAWVYGSYLNLQAVAAPAPAPQPQTVAAVPSGGMATANDAVNVRQGPSTGTAVLTVLRVGQAIETRGAPQGEWTPVRWNGQDAWVFSQYLTMNAGAAAVAQTRDSYTTDHVNLRSGPGLGFQIIRVLATNTKVTLTGVTEGTWSQVDDGGTKRWISSAYLSDAPVAGSNAQGAWQGPTSNGGPAAGTLNFGGSSGLDQLRPGAKNIVKEVRERYPYLTTLYGYRQDPLPDHPSGRAIDIMMPNGAGDPRGDEIASWLQANADRLGIEYLIWKQRIWINGDGDRWEPMADRGGVTANHYDHIHITINP